MLVKQVSCLTPGPEAAPQYCRHQEGELASASGRNPFCWFYHEHSIMPDPICPRSSPAKPAHHATQRPLSALWKAGWHQLPLRSSWRRLERFPVVKMCTIVCMEAFASRSRSRTAQPIKSRGLARGCIRAGEPAAHGPARWIASYDCGPVDIGYGQDTAFEHGVGFARD